jgi:hypothetical protein
MGHLRIPDAAAIGPAVDEQEGRLTGAPLIEMDPDSVEGDGDAV